MYWVKKRLVGGVLERGDTRQRHWNRFEKGRRNRNVNLQCFPYTRCTLSFAMNYLPDEEKVDDDIDFSFCFSFCVSSSFFSLFPSISSDGFSLFSLDKVGDSNIWIMDTTWFGTATSGSVLASPRSPFFSIFWWILISNKDNSPIVNNTFLTKKK